MTNKSYIDGGTYINGPETFVYGVGAVATIEQNVLSLISGSGNICTIEQKVKYKSTGPKILLTQQVIPPGINSKITKYGWDTQLYINGYQIPPSQISGKIEAIRVENDEAKLKFVIMPPRGAVYPQFFEGLQVIQNAQTSNGCFRVYTGYIETADIDFNKRMITVTCTDKRKDYINANLETYIQGIGYYDPSQKATDPFEELNRRLETVPYALNLDVAGNPVLSSLFAGSVDFIITNPYYDNADVEVKDPKITITPRSKITNTVYINYTYRHKRLHHIEVPYTWSIGISNLEFVEFGSSVPKRLTIETAIKGTSWIQRGNIGYTPVLSSGFYTLSDGTKVAVNWSITTSMFTGAATTTDDNGNSIPVIDSTGGKVLNAYPTAIVDTSQDYCFGAQWTLVKQFTQNIEEKYALTIQAQDSVNQFGIVSVTESGSTSDSYDNSVWDNLTSYQRPPTNTTLTYGDHNRGYYWYEYTELATYQNSILTAINKASNTIVKSHRNHRVEFSIPFDPRIQLHHTVTLNTTSHEGVVINARGKVYNVKHSVDPQTSIGYTTIVLALSLSSGGSQSSSSLVTPTSPLDSPTPWEPAYALGSHFAQPPISKWTGWIGNEWIKTRTKFGFNWQRTTYTESFVIDTPTIPTQYTNNSLLSASQTYNIAIINDTLSVTI